MDWHPRWHRRQDILVNVTRAGWGRALGRRGGGRVAVCHLHGGQRAVLGVDGNHLAHLVGGAVVRLLVEVVEEELATAARAVKHLWSTHLTGAGSSSRC